MKEINEAYLDWALKAIKFGIRVAQDHTKDIPKTYFNFGGVTSIIQNNGLSIRLGQLDLNYQLLDEKTMHKVWEYLVPIVSELRYKTDFWDCDNFASLTSILASLLFGINSFGEGYGKIPGVGMHYFNIIPTSEETLWIGEPMNGYIEKKVKGKDIILPNGWEYQPRSVRFF